ncbi:MAG: DUF2336 domain-containing protein [Methyloligellaceae bacterium]
MQLPHENQSQTEAIASDPAYARNRDLLQHVTDLFLRTLDQQSADDLDVFGDVLDKLAYQLDSGLRANLSERLAVAERAPVKLVKKLARDTIDVAKHVLELSPCLDDGFLVDIIRAESQDHIFAVAGRPLLPPLVTDEIVIHGEHYVLYRITSNPGAYFSGEGLEALAANAMNNPELGHALGTRSDLPEELKERISGHAAEIRPAEFFALDIEGVGDTDTLMEASHQKGGDADGQDLYAEEDVEETILSYSADLKDIDETAENFAKIVGIPLPSAKYLLTRGAIPGLAIICKANRMKTETFAALLNFRLAAQNLSPANAAPNIERYKNLGIRTAQRLASLMKMKLAQSLDE